MTNPLQTIPNLPVATSIGGTEELWLNQAGTDRRGTTAQIAAYAASIVSVGSTSFIGIANNVSNTPLLPAIAKGQTDFLTTGYYIDGDGGNAHYYHNTGSSIPGDLVSVDGVRLSLAIGQVVNVKMFGAKADNTTDNISAFNAAISWSFFFKSMAGYSLGGPSVFVPIGEYYLSDALTITHGMRLFGDGAGGAGGSGSTLRWPVNKNGIKVQTSGCQVSGLTLYGVKGTANILYPGIWNVGQNEYDTIAFFNWSGDCIYIDGVTGNSNSCYITRCFFQGSSRSAVFFDGADSNGGGSFGVVVTTCDRYGIEDSSFLGNQHFAFEIDACTLGAYTSDPSGNTLSVFNGYTETGIPGFLGPNDIAFGNQFGGVTGGSGLLRGNGFDSGGLGAGNGFYVSQTSNAIVTVTGTATAQHNGVPGVREIVSAGNTTWYESVGGAGRSYTTSPFQSPTPLLYLGNDTTLVMGRSTPPNTVLPEPVILQNCFIGVGDAARFLGSASAAPISGEYAVGDTFRNNAAVLGGNGGWICTTAGGVATTAWVASTVYGKSTLVLNDTGKTYVCITAGTSASSGGPTGTGSNITDGTAHWKYLATFVFSEFGTIKLQGAATYDPPSLADGVGTTTTVTCTGAALGDFAMASFSLDLQGITVTAWVSSANTVSVRFQNESGGTLDLGSGTLLARVTKQ